MTNGIGCAARSPQDVFEGRAMPKAVEEQINVRFGEMIKACRSATKHLGVPRSPSLPYAAPVRSNPIP